MDRRTGSFREQLESSLRKTLSRSKSTRQSADLPSPAQLVQASAAPPPGLREEVKRKQAAELDKLPERYYQDEFDAVLHELQQLPPYFSKEDLDAVVEARASVLETVSGTLSEHVMAKYDQFAAGVEDVRQVDAGLQAAHGHVRVLRSELALAAAEVASNLTVAAKQRRKQGFVALLTTLAALQEASQLHAAFMDAQASLEFAGAFWLAAQCARALEPIAELRIAEELGQSASALYAGTVQHLEAALSAACADFRPEQYVKVLEGYVYLGEITALGDEVLTAFTSAISSAATRVVRGVVVSRAGLEERARATAIFGELVKLLPADLFRPCLAQVMMVVFDILANHLHMYRWHEARCKDHAQDVAALQAARAELDARLAQANAEDTAADSAAAGQGTAHAANGATSHPHGSPDGRRSPQRAASPHANGFSTPERQHSADLPPPASPAQLSPSAVEAAKHRALTLIAKPRRVASLGSHLDRAASGTASGTSSPLANGHVRAVSVDDLRVRFEQAEPALLGSPARSTADPATVNGLGGIHSALEAEAAAVQEKEQEAEAWGQALTGVARALSEGRRRLWEEAARKLGALLAAPAAFQGEHFLQVLDWTQTMLTAGEAFSGAESGTLRDAIARQSGRFFQAYHAANLQALHQMLEQEMWQKLPVEAGSLPSLAHALEGSAGASRDGTTAGGALFDTNSFAAWVARGNPWRKQVPGEASDGVDTPRHSAAASDDEDDAPELYGETIDEDSQQVTSAADRSGVVSTSGRLAEEGPAMTASGWRLLRWAAHYGGLMRAQRSQAGQVFSGMAELFELYLLHAFHCFADVPLASLAQGGQQRQGGADVIPVRLKNAILRILSRSLHKYRTYYLPSPPAPGQAASPQPSAEHTALSNPGNMYGLQERKVAADSLRRLSGALTEAAPALHEALAGCPDIPDQHAPEVFFQTVKAATDLVEVMYRAVARLNVQLGWVPDRLAEGNFNLEEPPERASPWVGVLLSHLATFRQKLDTAALLTPDDIALLWGSARAYAAEVLLEGMARAGVKSRCTPMGRSAMSLDLQAVQRGLQQLETGPNEVVVDALRIVDAYIKAFYLPAGPELRRWAQTHPEYTRPQLLALASCIADANSLKRKDKAALVAQVEADLGDIRIGR